MKKTISFIHRNFEYSLIVNKDQLCILDHTEQKLYENTLHDFAVSDEPLIKFAYYIYQSLIS